jgi:hypothetical protein
LTHGIDRRDSYLLAHRLDAALRLGEAEVGTALRVRLAAYEHSLAFGPELELGALVVVLRVPVPLRV